MHGSSCAIVATLTCLVRHVSNTPSTLSVPDTCFKGSAALAPSPLKVSEGESRARKLPWSHKHNTARMPAPTIAALTRHSRLHQRSHAVLCRLQHVTQESLRMWTHLQASPRRQPPQLGQQPLAGLLRRRPALVQCLSQLLEPGPLPALPRALEVHPDAYRHASKHECMRAVCVSCE